MLRCEIEGDDFSNKTKEYTIKPANGKIGEFQSPFYHKVFVTRKVQKSIETIFLKQLYSLWQYGFWSFQGGGWGVTKLERLLPINILKGNY